MAVSKGVDSFASNAEADSINSEHPFGSSWESVSGDMQDALLRWATRLLNTMIPWRVHPTDPDQPLVFPARYLVSITGGYEDSDEIPTPIVYATVEYARRLGETGGSILNNQGVVDQDIRALPGGLAFGGGARRKPIPDAVLELIPQHWRGSVNSVQLRRV